MGSLSSARRSLLASEYTWWRCLACSICEDGGAAGSPKPTLRRLIDTPRPAPTCSPDMPSAIRFDSRTSAANNLNHRLGTDVLLRPAWPRSAAVPGPCFWPGPLISCSNPPVLLRRSWCNARLRSVDCAERHDRTIYRRTLNTAERWAEDVLQDTARRARTTAHVAAGLVGRVPGGFFIRPLPRHSSQLAG